MLSSPAPIIRPAVQALTRSAASFFTWLCASTTRFLIFCLLVCCALRILSITRLPLLDRTEARVALISSEILTQHDWFKLEIDKASDHEVYQAKPPLHYWLVAGSMKLLGKNELAVRFPGAVAFVLILICVLFVGWRFVDLETGLISTLLLTSSGLFFLVQGLGLIDSTLTLTSFASMLACVLMIFANELRARRFWALVFGLFLALSFDLKGPIGMAIVAGGLILWGLWRGRGAWFFEQPWGWVAAAFALFSVPYYLLVELHSPHFLRYFFVNENIYRYLFKEFGETTGSGHVQPYGMSWIYLLLSFLPWSLLLLLVVPRFLRQSFSRVRAGITLEAPPRILDLQGLFLFWGLTPAIIFTFARQHLATYLLPGFAPLAIFLAIDLLREPTQPLGVKRSLDRLLPFFMFLSGLIVTIAAPFLGAGLRDFIFVLILFAAMLFAVRFASFNQEPAKRLAALALAATLILTFSTLTIANLLAVRSSTKGALERLSRHEGEQAYQMSFPQGIPYSASFYTKQPLSEKRPAAERDKKSEPPIFYFVRAREEKILRAENDKLKLVFKTGKWLVFESE